MYPTDRDYSCKRAIKNSVFSNGHQIVSLENVSSNRGKRFQTYELILNRYVPHEDILSEFANDFEDYYYGTTSYLKVDDIRAIENTLDNILGAEHYSNTLCTIVVRYHKDYRPFPCEMSYKQLLKQNECMQDSLNKMRKILCENLLEKSPIPECPVCYFDLKKETIELPMCFHAICKGCFNKCSKCPLCRKDYYTFK
jgi:hypothetical protein